MRPLVAFLLGLGVAGRLPAQVADWHRLPLLATLTTKTLAFDDHRGRLILFESSERAGVSATWEWVGNSWSLRRTANTPTPRQAFAAGYDPVRHRLVMVGGTDDSFHSLRNDTWEYDGVDWHQVFPTTSPPPMHGGWLGFDHADTKMLLAWGVTASGPPVHLFFDGVTWSPVPPALASGSVAASDPLRGRLVGLGSTTTTNGLAITTWEWDGSSWTQQFPAHQPPMRVGGACAWHPGRGTVVLQGGHTPTQIPSYFTDMWEWDGVDWSQVYLYPFVAPPRAYFSLAYDCTNHALVAVGGSDAATIATDTLRYDGSLFHHHGTGTGRDSYRSAAFDPVRDRLLVIGDRALLRGLEWDGVRWSDVALPPGMRTCQSLAYDPLRGVTVVVGMLGTTMQTWERNGTTWSQPIPTPAVTGNCRLVWHAGLGQMLALVYSTNNVGSLLAWNGLQWQSVANSSGAPYLQGPPVYDASRNELVMPESTTGGLAMQVWTPSGWTQRVPTTSPPFRFSSRQLSMAYDDSRQRVVLFGGRDPNYGTPPNCFQYFQDLWEWDGANWSQRVLPNAPPGRDGALLTFDPLRQRLLLIGGERTEGNGALLTFADVWALDAATPADITFLGPGCGGIGGAPQLVASSPHVGADAFAVDLQASAANAPCLFAFGSTGPSTPLGAGCTGYLTPLVVTFGLTSATGFASRHGAIPPGYQGMTFAAQAAVLDPATPLGIALSPGLAIRVGT